jgi:hypothetical protein
MRPEPTAGAKGAVVAPRVPPGWCSGVSSAVAS